MFVAKPQRSCEELLAVWLGFVFVRKRQWRLLKISADAAVDFSRTYLGPSDFCDAENTDGIVEHDHDNIIGIICYILFCILPPAVLEGDVVNTSKRCLDPLLCLDQAVLHKYEMLKCCVTSNTLNLDYFPVLVLIIHHN